MYNFRQFIDYPPNVGLVSYLIEGSDRIHLKYYQNILKWSIDWIVVLESAKDIRVVQ